MPVELTRRRLFAASLVVAGIGVGDVACSSRSSVAPNPLGLTGATTRPKPRGTTANQNRPVPNVDHTPAAHAGRHHSGDAPTHSHRGAAHHGSHPGHGGHGHRGHGHHDVRVTLPRSTTPVRRHPAYKISDIMPVPHGALALTIDDGPSPEWTPRLLRLLDHHGVQATFCMIGARVEEFPRLARDVAGAGHSIANHSYTHVQPFAGQTEKRVVAEITRTQRAIEKATKVTPELFRAPGGDWSRFVLRAVAAYDLVPLDWDIDPVDWEQPGVRAIRRAMLRARHGDIVLSHDGGGDRRQTVKALHQVLPRWHRRGLHVVPLRLPEPPTPTPPAAPTPSPTLTPPSPTPTPTPTA